MVSLTEAVYVATIWHIWRDFGWQVFKRIGADRGIKRAYAWYQGRRRYRSLARLKADPALFRIVFLCILKFDAFFFCAFSLQIVLLVLQQNDLEVCPRLAKCPDKAVLTLPILV